MRKPVLRELRRVIPVALVEQRGGLSLAVLALELYAEGFLIRIVIRDDERSAFAWGFRKASLRSDLTPHRNDQPAFQALDDAGRQYSAWLKSSNCDDEQCTLEYSLAPALWDDAQHLVLEIPIPALVLAGMSAATVDAEPAARWRLTLSLDNTTTRLTPAQASSRIPSASDVTSSPRPDLLTHVKAIVGTANDLGFALTLLTLECHRTGFVLRSRLRSEGTEGGLPGWPEISFELRDDRGRQYEGWESGSQGSSHAWDLAHTFGEPLSGDASELRVDAAGSFRDLTSMHRLQVGATPAWHFKVPLLDPP